MSLEMVSRREWGSLQTRNLPQLELPATRVFYMNTSSDRCRDRLDCYQAVQLMQLKHIKEFKMVDISYSFLVGGDGGVYEGRGWRTCPAVPRAYSRFKRTAIIIAFIGRLNEINMPEKMKRACGDLIDLGVEKGYISKTYRAISMFKIRPTHVFPDYEEEAQHEVVEVF